MLSTLSIYLIIEAGPLLELEVYQLDLAVLTGQQAPQTLLCLPTRSGFHAGDPDLNSAAQIVFTGLRSPPRQAVSSLIPCVVDASMKRLPDKC